MPVSEGISTVKWHITVFKYQDNSFRAWRWAAAAWKEFHVCEMCLQMSWITFWRFIQFIRMKCSTLLTASTLDSSPSPVYLLSSRIQIWCSSGPWNPRQRQCHPITPKSLVLSWVCRAQKGNDPHESVLHDEMMPQCPSQDSYYYSMNSYFNESIAFAPINENLQNFLIQCPACRQWAHCGGQPHGHLSSPLNALRRSGLQNFSVKFHLYLWETIKQ